MNSSISSEESTYYAAEYLRYVDMRKMYMNIWSDPEATKQISNVFKIFLDENTKGALIHCTSGKDRTSILALQIQYGLGVVEEVVNDYYASSLPYYIISESLALDLERHGYSLELSNRAREFLGISGDMSNEITKWGNEEYKDAYEYASKKLLFTMDDVRKLQNKFLD